MDSALSSGNSEQEQLNLDSVLWVLDAEDFDDYLTVHEYRSLALTSTTIFLQLFRRAPWTVPFSSTAACAVQSQ